jgi:hypothetical protein
MLHQDNCQQEVDLSHAPAALSSGQSAHGRQNAHPWLRSIVATGAILLLLASIFVSSQHVSAQQAATLRCRVDKTTVAVDANATLFIEVVDVADLYGYELTLKFNGSRIHFVDADPGKSGINLQVGDFLSPDFVVLNEANNGTGQATLALTQLSPSVAVSGTGELARATLVGVAPGLVSFSFADVVLSDPAGVAIPATLQGCSIEVTGGNATATPTPTGTGTPATPTPTPTPTPDGNDTGAIAGSVFLDANADGARQPSEGGLRAFVALYRLGTDRQWADMTDDNGDFLFSNLPAGRYFLEVRTLDGISYFYTTESTYDILLGVGGSSLADFGLNLSGGRIWIVYMPQVGQDTLPPAGTGDGTIVYLPVLSQVVVVYPCCTTLAAGAQTPLAQAAGVEHD